MPVDRRDFLKYSGLAVIGGAGATVGSIGCSRSSPLFGYMGDRYGRRMALIIGAAFFSIITMGMQSRHTTAM